MTSIPDIVPPDSPQFKESIPSFFNFLDADGDAQQVVDPNFLP